MPRQTTHLPVPAPFDLRLCLFGHGWVALAPHDFAEDTQTFTTVLRIGERAVDTTLRQRDAGRLQLTLATDERLSAAELAVARSQLAHMLRLDDDLAPFHSVCRGEPKFAWVARRGAGRLLRSATVFEDLMKLLFTTNTTWAGTEAMTNKLVAARGSPAPSGRRAFPSAAQCVADAAFYRDVVRAGYRADAAVALATAFASGELDDATFLAPQPAEVLWKRLLGLRGFGPYAAGQAMRLLGHYEQLAIDSWCRARRATLTGRKAPPSDRAIGRRYAGFAPFQGLAMWMELTAEWHGEA